jgi:hypothetical protein
MIFLISGVQAQNNLVIGETLSVNELHMVPDSGRSGQPLKISYTINNTDQFSAFQFDIILPSVMTFVQDSVSLFRRTDHIVIANQLNPQTLRILAYSLSNQPFNGNDGEVVRVMFNLDGSAGTYNVGLNNVTISNPIGQNILTGYFPGFIKITAPDISGNTNIDFGEVSVLDTLNYGYQLYNTGNDTLFVTEFSSSETFFWVDTPLPNYIPPFDSITFILKFHNIIKGQYSTTYTIRTNDPDEDPFYLDATALSFAPNYILIQNAEAYVRDTVTLKIEVDNYEQFVDFQVDLEFPDSLYYIPNSASLTNRKQDHILYETILSPNKIRLFSYSLNQLPFLGDTGTVATMNFLVGNDTGTFPLHLSGGVLFDFNSQNIIRETIDGEIYVQRRPTFQLEVTVANGWNMVSVPGFNVDGQGIDSWWSGRDPGTDVFIYDNGYQTVTSVTPGEGYWMKHIGIKTYNTGDEWPADGIETVPHNPIDAVAGWNLIGGYEDTVLTIDLTTTPPGLISGPIYGYTGGYNIVSELLPGYAYWIKLTGTGLINFSSTFYKKSNNYVEYFKDSWGRIILTDAAGRTTTLYAVNGSVNLELYELPPIPPAGMFDVRFGSGRIAENLSNVVKTIELSGIEYPFTVTAENMNLKLQDESSRLLTNHLMSDEKIIISNNSINKLLVIAEELTAPAEYLLEQNYPNPFNPVTTIKFSLPEATNVKLNIYNTLGEKVAVLENGDLDSGYHSYEWNAGSLASGIYIYELRTDNFVAMKKMILLK